MPKDDNRIPTSSRPFERPGLLPRFTAWLFAAGKHARHTVHGTHLELFRMRGELAMLRDAAGRTDILTLDGLFCEGRRHQIEALIRARTQTVPLPDGTVLCRTLGRFKMFTDAADGGMAPHLMLDGYWEYWITEFVTRNLERGQTAWDIGTVYGYYTVLFADLVGAEGRVVALEPNPWLHWLLRRNISVNGLAGRVTIHRLAADEAKQDSVRVPANLTGPFTGRFANWFAFEGGRASCPAPGAALEDLEPGRVDFLRIGIATAADRVVAGMAGLLDRNPELRILLEFNAERCANAEAMLATLAARYPLRYVDGDSRAKPCTIEELLTQRRVTTLYLSKLEPR